MFDFMKHRPKPQHPKPPARVHDCVDNIDAWRRYALDEMEATFQRLIMGMNSVSPETLEKLPEMIAEIETIEQRVTSALTLMQGELNALKTMLNSPETIGYTVKPVLHPASGNLEFKVVVIDG